MGWESRRYGRYEGYRRGGRWFSHWSGENPLDWSLPLYTAGGIAVRVHVVFVVLVAMELLWAGARGSPPVGWVVWGMAGLFALVLAHEYGHCVACRWVGGEADRILMWPLGGLAYCRPPHRWQADLVTTLGGPAVNVVLVPVLWTATFLLAGGWVGWQALIPGLLDPWPMLSDLARVPGSNTMRWVRLGAGWLHYLNLMLLLVNVLLPMYPLDGGRIVHGLLWWRVGYRRATRLAVNIGLAAAVVVFLLGMAWDSSRLAAIGIFCGLVCWMERRGLAEGDDQAWRESWEAAEGTSRQHDRTTDRRRRRQQRDQAELDRILEKIARSGMESLTWRERRWLARATRRRQKE